MINLALCDKTERVNRGIVGGSLQCPRLGDTISQSLMILLALSLLLVFPQDSYAMIELLPAFFAIAIGGVILIGALIASIVKTLIIRYLAAGEKLPSFKRIAAVAVSDMITMGLAATVALTLVQNSLVPANPHKALAFVTFFLSATVIHMVIAFWPNSFLLESPARAVSQNETALSGMAMAAILALSTPLVVILLCLIIGYTVGG
jgi:hypothetical protein